MNTSRADLTPLESAVWDRSGRKEGAEVRFLCPAHDDHNPSARWNPGKETWHCDACKEGGGFKDLAQRLEVDLNPKQSLKAKVEIGSTPRPKVVATYDYFSADGTLLFHVDWREPGKDGKAKDFLQRRPNGAYGLGDTQPVLYRLPQVLEQVSRGGAVYLVEGEKDVHTLEALGKVATCNPMGAGKWRDEYAETLEGAHLVLLPDNDEVGKRHMHEVAHSLGGKVQSLRIVILPDLPHKSDITDWLTSGHTSDGFDTAVNNAPLWMPEKGKDYLDFVRGVLVDVSETARKTSRSTNQNAAPPSSAWTQ